MKARELEQINCIIENADKVEQTTYSNKNHDMAYFSKSMLFAPGNI
jgi:hypothetical protein